MPFSAEDIQLMHRDEQAATAAASMARTIASHYHAYRQQRVSWLPRLLLTLRFAEAFYQIVIGKNLTDWQEQDPEDA